MTEKIAEKLSFLAGAYSNKEFITFRGLERESLRADEQGHLALTPHPEHLGSKLTHPLITTDFSEAQLELITPASKSIESTLTQLEDIHRFVYTDLGDEVMWSASLPCIVQGDENIPLARYGDSNLGRLKTTYRNGLANRYGRLMQTISAVHYNFSFGDEFWADLAQAEQRENSAAWRSKRYFDLIRNFRRFSWLPIYLFGASPAVCESFIKGRDAEKKLEKLSEGTYGLSGGTSLRNSGILGYQSKQQSDLLNICYNSLDNYVNTLTKAVCTPHPQFKDLDLTTDGTHTQVNPNILQSEAEFYTTIRAKRVARNGENFLDCLQRDGVEYIEVRLLDVNPYSPIGFTKEQANFIDTLLLYSLLLSSPEHNDQLCAAVTNNVTKVVEGGRLAKTELEDGPRKRSVMDWGLELTRELEPVAKLLDQITEGGEHLESLNNQIKRLKDSSLTLSAQILNDVEKESKSYFRFAMDKAQKHRAYFNNTPLSSADLEHFKALSRKSVEDQRAIDAKDQLPFEDYLKKLQNSYADLL
ncbi:MAG: glutamate--cysteine ligase [Candidatus Azotimanducaceae bacterium]|jgi:glutamate--cysteine ligase